MPCKENTSNGAPLCSDESETAKSEGSGVFTKNNNNNNNRPSAGAEQPPEDDGINLVRHYEVDALVNQIKLSLRLGFKSGGNCPADLVTANSSSSDYCGGLGSAASGGRVPLMPKGMPEANGNSVSGGKTPTLRQQQRSSRSAPYFVPSSLPRSGENSVCFRHSSSLCLRLCRCVPPRSCSSPPDQPYMLLQELIKEGALIKEAVRRINVNEDGMNDDDGPVPSIMLRDYDYETDIYEESTLLELEAI